MYIIRANTAHIAFLYGKSSPVKALLPPSGSINTEELAIFGAVM